jgi:ferredoxin-NADP reductase
LLKGDVYLKLKLVERKKLFEDVESFILEPEQPVQWEPGQYMHYVFAHDNPDERGTARWFTISAAPVENHLMITTRFTAQEGSSFKRALGNMRIGDSIESDDGPKGKFVISEPSKKHIFIAGGIGITPFRSILLQADHDGQELKVELLYTNRDENFVFGDELAALKAKHPNFHIHKFVGDKRIEEADFRPYVDDLRRFFMYLAPGQWSRLTNKPLKIWVWQKAA